jgi:hypothetical protein
MTTTRSPSLLLVYKPSSTSTSPRCWTPGWNCTPPLARSMQ